jgi:hypothetical protein
MNMGKNNQPTQFIAWFIYSVGAVFMITGIAKVWSAFGHTKLLELNDPFFRVPFRDLLFIVGLIELAISFMCFTRKDPKLVVGCIAYVATGFLAYRLALWMIHWGPCHCLGTLTDTLNLPPHLVDVFLKIVLAYLLIGSYAVSFWLWRSPKKAVPASLPAQ